MRAAWPFVISWASIGLWATAFQSICSWVSGLCLGGPPQSPRGALTSLRFFCCSIAKRNRAMMLSLLEDMVTMSTAGAQPSPLKGQPKGNERIWPRRRRGGLWFNLSFTAHW